MTHDELWQPLSSQSDLVPYWEYWCLDPQHKRERRRRVCHTLLCSPPTVLLRPAPYDGMPLFLNMPSSGSLMWSRGPPLFGDRGCEYPPHPATLGGESHYSCIRKQTPHEYWKGVLACSVCFAILRFRVERETASIVQVEQLNNLNCKIYKMGFEKYTEVKGNELALHVTHLKALTDCMFRSENELRV